MWWEIFKIKSKKIFFLSVSFTLIVSPGCSISTSVGTSSESSSNLLSSISKSSEGTSENLVSKRQQEYQKDVAAFTDSFIHQEMISLDYMIGLGRIANRHGITDWELSPDTYIAIGFGLKEAGLKKDRLTSCSLVQSVVKNKKDVLTLIMAGYEKGLMTTVHI